MRKFTLLFAVLLSLVGVTTALAQQALPYSYGFENNDLATEGWTTQNPSGKNSSEFGINTAAKKTGSYGFRFSSYSGQGENTQYLISPELSAPKGVTVSFVYAASSTSTSGELFKVGYSTTDTNIESFTWGDEQTTKSMSWATFEGTMPAGTKYVAIYYYPNYQYRLYVDDISLTTPPTCIKPAGLTAGDITAYSATLSWNAGGSETSWEISYSTTNAVPAEEGSYTSVNNTTYNLTSLSAGTTYYVYVRSKAGDDYSAWSDVCSFTTTPVAVAAEGYNDDFEDACNWMLINGSNTNAWAWGSATNNGGSKALYISNDGGATNAYTNNSASMVYAKKFFSFEGGVYNFSYDWLGNGESTYDFMRVALVPANVELTAGTAKPSGFSATALPSGWIALDSGSKLNVQSSWQHANNAVAVETGSYYVVFAWTDDTSGGSNPAAAIDNFSITVQTCPVPSNLTVTDIAARQATLNWATSSNTWEVYCTTEEGTPAADVTVTAANISTNSYTFTGLASETKYYVWVRSVNGSDKSEWVGTNFTTDISCHAPTGVTVDGITSTGATVNWTSDADDFNVRYKKVSDADWTLVVGTISAKTYTLTGLTPATAYQVQVRTYCDATDQSAWTDAASFTTDCAAVTEFPFAENFNGIASGIPNCWNNTDGTTNTINYRWSYYATGHDGACLRFNSYNNQNGITNMLKTPAMNFPTGKIMQLTFWYKNPAGGDFSVFISNDGGTTYTTELATGLTGASAWTQKEIVLPTDFTENVVIVLKGTSNYGSGDAYIYLDDVTIDEAPACAKPTALAASNVTANSVELSWTKGSDEEAWQIAYGTTADFNADEATPVDVTSNPYTLTGLTSSTTYYICVRAKKGSDVSAWSDKVNFTTEASCITPTEFAVSATTINSATLTWTDATEQSKWEVSYSTTSGAPAEGTIVAVTEKTYTIEGLTAGTTYYASVRAVNSDDDKSAWSSEVSFIPGVVIANEGTTTNGNVPLYGYDADTANGTQCQFIIPSTSLTSVAGKQIDKIAFYSSYATRDWGNAVFDVYVKEVENTAFENTTLVDWTTMTKVYSGKLSVNDSQMVIEFENPFAYESGNLMIGLNQTAKGTYSSASWYGVSTSDYSALQKGSRYQFLPKTAIYYSPIVIASKMVVSETELAYGLVAPNSVQTKTFTIENKGKADLTGITVSSDNAAFTVTKIQNQTIAVGGDAITVTVTLNTESTGENDGTITISATGQEDAEIVVSGIVRDANKVYESGFTALPADWTTTGSWYYSETNGAYTTSWYLSNNTRLITPMLTISEGETFLVEAKGYSTSNTSYQHLQMQYSADGTTWTNFDDEPTLDPSTWNTFAFTGVPAGKYYIAINASQADIRMFYGGELPNVAKMVVTQPASLDFGVIEEATAKTFTIANTGKATLEGISVTASNSGLFSVTGAPTSLAAGASAEVTITMAATTTGAQNSNITVSATGMENVEFTVTGVVLPEGLMVIDFNDNQLPDKWNNASWTFDNGMATGKSNSAYLTTPVLSISEGDIVVIKAQCTDTDNSDYIQIQGSSDKGSTWTAYDKKIMGSDGLAKLGAWSTLVLSDIPTTVNKLRFVGYYVNIDEIVGLNYAPVLDVYKDGQGVAETSYYDFGECVTDASVTYNFSNYGGGTITITNVAITGEGAAAYSTNWTKSVAVPFDLMISRSYNAERVGASAAVVTVTTTEGTYVINVTGSDKGLNAPELAVSPAEDADFGTQLQQAPKAQVYTITNSGTGTLTGTITSSSEKTFTVSASEFSLGAGESMTFEIALVYDENYGDKTATIIIHPNNEGLEDVVINATASTLDPEAWTEDFAAGTLPTGWVATNWTVGTFSSYENKTTMALAPSSGTAGTLITPCLTAKEGDVLAWDAYFKWADEPLIVEYSTDNQTSWTNICTMYGTESGESGSGQVNYHKEMSFTAPADGNYYLRFTSTYQNGVDNFCGFKLNLPDHIMAISASSIPSSSAYYTTMKEGISFNATVTLIESRGVDEEVTAKFYMGDEVIGTTSGTVEAGQTKQLTIVCTPTQPATDGVEMHIEVEWAGSTLTTTPETRYVAAVQRLDLTENAETEITTGTTYDVITLTRNYVAGWNTFVSPLSVSLSEFGEGAKAYAFTGYDDGELKFSSAGSTLNPATPYVIYVPEKLTDKVLTWNNTSISSMFVGADNIQTTHNGAVFQGTFAPIAAPGMKGKYGLTTDANIKKGSEKASMKGFRAYFELPEGAQIKSMVFEDIETGVQTIRVSADDAHEMFDLSGRRSRASQRGIYIHNGKKIAIK